MPTGTYTDRQTGAEKHYVRCIGCKSKQSFEPNEAAGERRCCVILRDTPCDQIVRPGRDGKPNYACWAHKDLKVHHICGKCRAGYDAPGWRIHIENPLCKVCYRAQAVPQRSVAELLGLDIISN
jgi:hypothetical protein